MKVVANTDDKKTEDGAPVTPQGFIQAVALFLVCQLVGETLVRMLGVAVPGFAFPGPVVGMVILFILLVLRGTDRSDGGGGLERHPAQPFAAVRAGGGGHRAVWRRDR